VNDAGAERLALRGQKGDTGARGREGKRGQAGLSHAVRRALVFLFALAALLAALALFLTVRSAGDSQAAQRAAAQAAEHKICVTLGKLAALQPPAGNPLTNPARGYDQELHMTLDQLGPDLGCPRNGH